MSGGMGVHLGSHRKVARRAALWERPLVSHERQATFRYRPETPVTLQTGNIGDTATMASKGGCRCHGWRRHQWISAGSSSARTDAACSPCRSCVRATRSAGRPATSSSRALRRSAARTRRIKPLRAPTPAPRTWLSIGQWGISVSMPRRTQIPVLLSVLAVGAFLWKRDAPSARAPATAPALYVSSDPTRVGISGRPQLVEFYHPG